MEKKKYCQGQKLNKKPICTFSFTEIVRYRFRFYCIFFQVLNFLWIFMIYENSTNN